MAQALDSLGRDFGEFGLENETRDLERFYESVRMRAQGLDNSDARQHVLMELYEKFFATALKKDADRLGIVYTPVEVVDFIVNSADHVVRQEFGRGLSDEGVHVLDPFTGTGIFFVRLLQSALIRDTDLKRKYHGELHANEIVLLAYYIAAIHIEEAFHGRRGPDSAYAPFDGIVLTDTFNLYTDRTGFPKAWLPDNSERAERQQDLPIQVIVGNPPWSAGQRSSADNNPNVDYPELEKRVGDTYAARSKATLKNSLYDTYKMAIRWASDRIGDQGVIALVTNGSWIDGNVDSGVRACLAEEFSSIYVLNLRGNARTSGKLRREEGDNVFGQGSRAPVAITILVRNPDAAHSGCHIRYRDVGDYLKREEKLAILRKAGSIAGIEDWRTIEPDRHHDWIGQRSDAFQKLYPMGSKTAKTGKADDAIFKLFSNGYKTSRDAYIYNFSRDACAENARKMVDDYLGAMQELKEARVQDRASHVEDITHRHSSNVRWDRELKNNLKRRKSIAYQRQNINPIQYRPFVKQHCYVEYVLVNNKYQMDRIFPKSGGDNRAISVPGQRYVLISTGQPFPKGSVGVPATVSCAGISAADLSLDNALNLETTEYLQQFGISQSRSVDVWPAGLAASRWDGEGAADWLSSEAPCIGIRSDYDVESFGLVLDNDANTWTEVRPTSTGQALFIELPELPLGPHELGIKTKARGDDGPDATGHLQILVREPTPWEPGFGSQGAILIVADPTTPSMEDMWEGKATVEIHGPPSRRVRCSVVLFERRKDEPFLQRTLPPLGLPATGPEWRDYFEQHFRRVRDCQNGYDLAQSLAIRFDGEELGAFTLTCEREFTPLRWVVRHSSQGYRIRLLDDVDAADEASLKRYDFTDPERGLELDAREFRRFRTKADPGLYVAESGGHRRAVVIPPLAVKTFSDMRICPQIQVRDRSRAVLANC